MPHEAQLKASLKEIGELKIALDEHATVAFAERRHANEELLIAHSQLSQLLEHSPAVLYVVKLDGDKLVPRLVSENITRLLGFTVAETLSYEWWLAQLHPDGRGAALKSIAETLQAGTSQTEYRLRHKDGNYCWVDDARRLIRDAAGEPVELIGVWTDITERKRTEAIVRESERRFREVLENLELIAMTLDKKGSVTFCNDFLLRLTGWEREEVIGHLWFDRFLPDSATAVRNLFFDTIESGKIPAHFQNPIKTRMGELREIAWNNTVLRDGTGNIIGTASIGEDVTDRSRAEEALRESETRFRELAEHIQEVFWVADPDKTQKRYISPAFEKIWGHTCQSAYESPHIWLEAVRPEDRDRVLQAIRAKQARGSYDEEYRIIRPDGAERWIHDRAFPMRDAAGLIKRWVGAAEDITERRLLEEQFRQAQKMEAVGTLAAGIAHDFNNILAAISGNAELARMVLSDNPEVREHLGAVLQATRRATDLVRQNLAFSRQQAPERRPIHLEPILAESLKLLRSTIPSTIAFDTSLATDAPLVLADATQVHQIMMNLGTCERRDEMNLLPAE